MSFPKCFYRKDAKDAKFRKERKPARICGIRQKAFTVGWF